MKLYAFRPRGWGEYSYFVMAGSEAEAWEAVMARINIRGRTNELLAVGTGCYDVSVHGDGDVVENDNDC